MSANKEILMKFITAQNEKIRKDVSMQGYKDTSPYKNNPSNTIYGSPQGTPITMKGVSIPLIGIDEFGNMQEMVPGEEYFFPGSRVKETRMQNGGQNIYNVSMNNPMIVPSQGMNPVGYYDTLPKNEAGIPYDKDGTLFTQSKMVSRFDENGKPLSAAQVRENQKMWNMQKMAYSPEQQTFNLWKNNPQNTEQGFYNTREYGKYLKNIIPTGKDVGLDGLCDPNFSSTKCGTSKQHAKEDKKEWSKKQEGGEKDFTNVQEWFNKYIDSPLYRRNIENSGYENVDDVIAQRKANVNRTGYELDENRLGTYYKNTSNKIHNAPKTDSKNWSKQYPSVLPNDSVLAHEFGHAVLDSNQSWFGSLKPFWNKNDYDQLESRNKNKRVSRGAMENYADQKELQYTAAKLGIYNPGFEEFTEEHLDKLPTDLKDRALQNYSKEDLIWLMNNIAQNDDNSNDQLAIAQRGGATRADSLALYNNALNKIKFYKGNSDYRKDFSKTNFKSDKVRKNLIKNYKKIGSDNRVPKWLIDEMIENPKEANKPLTPAEKSAMEQKINTVKFGPVRDTNLISFGDILDGEIDTYYNPLSPPIYLHPNISPQGSEQYYSDRFGDTTDIPYYDPIAVAPFDVIKNNPKLVAERIKKYGTSGIPKSYLSKNSIEKETDKPVEVKPQLQPRVEAVNIQPIEQTPINIPVQELDFNTPIKAPKSYNVNMQRYNMQGPSDYYQANEEGVDYQRAIEIKAASDAYNKYIQEKYGNEDALKNPKAAERLKQLRSEFNIEYNYKFGGDLYQYQNGSQTWDKQKQNLKNEKLEKLKRLLSLPDPVFKAKTFEEKVAEKMEQEKYKTTSKDNTAVRNYNNANKHSNAARNKTNKEFADERQAKIDAQVQANKQPFDWNNFRQSLSDRSQATGDAMRISNEPNFFDDYINPAVMIGSMADNLGQAPLRAQQEDSYMPYVTSVGAPLMLGAAAGLGTANNAQFINNIVNPVAGADDLLKGILAPKNILVDEQYMGNNLMLNALNDVKSTTLPSKTKLNELRDALEHGEQWKYPDMNLAEEITRLKKSAKTEADIAYIDALEKQYDKNVSWHDAARNRANPVFLTGQSIEDMVNPLFKNPEGDQWFAMQQFRHAEPKGKHFGYMADEADYIHASKYRLPGNRFDTEGMMKDIGDDASMYFNERYKPLSPDFKNLPLNQKGGLVNFLQKAQGGKEIPKLNVTKFDLTIPKSTGYAWADERLKQQNKALEEFIKVKKKVDIEVKKIQKKHNVSESTAREVYKRQQGLSEQQQPEEVRQYTPQSTLSKVKEIALNPMTAAGYKVRNEDIPENFSRSEDTRNNLDTAVDFINPAWYAESAKNLVQNQGQVFSDLSEGNFQDAGINQLMAGVEALNFIPLAKGTSPLLNKGLKQLGNIKTSVAPELRQGLQTNGIFSPEYLKGLKITATKKLFDSRAANTEENLKRLKLLASPKTLKAIGNIDAPIADKMLYDFMTKRGDNPSVKQFRTDVKKATLEANRIKKLNPEFDFSPDIFKHPDLVNHANDYLLSKPEYLSKFVNAKKAAEKTISNKQNVKSFLEKEYVKKIDVINQYPILKKIADESPQYVNDIYNHLKNPIKSTDEFVNDLIKQSNTFTRAMHKSMDSGQMTKVDFFTPQGRSMGYTGKNTIDVEGFPTSDNFGEYGKNRYKIFPNEERMADITSTPLEERWAKRFPNTFAGNENIDFGLGMHGNVENDFLHNAIVQRRLRNNMLVGSGSAPIQPKPLKSDIIPYKYLYQPKHVVFNTPEQGQLIKGFDVEQVGDTWNPFKPSEKFGLEPGYTHGFKYGGIIKDDRGQWDYPREITQIAQEGKGQIKAFLKGGETDFEKYAMKEMGGMLYANKNAKLPHEQSMKKYSSAQKNLLEFMHRIKANGGMVPFDEYYKQNIIFPRNKS